MYRSLIFLLLPMVSCKTIEFSERRVFPAAPYDLERTEQFYTQNLPAGDTLQAKLAFVRSVIRGDEEIVARKGDVVLHRKFFPVNDSIVLEYFVFQPPQEGKTGVFFHGSGLNIFTFTDRFFDLSARTNSKIYLLHYRGYGNSGGTPSYAAQFADNQAFLEQAGPVDFAMGYSLGTTFATYLAADNALNALILFAPVSTSKHAFRNYKRKQTPGLKSITRPFTTVRADPQLMRLSNADKIRDYQGALTIFHGTADQRLPFRMGKYLYKTARTSEKVLIPIKDGVHSSPFLLENWEMVVERLK